MQIRELENKDLVSLMPLVISMYKSIDEEITEFGAMNTIFFGINEQEDYTLIGLFDDKDQLVGFVSGYKFSKKIFSFSGIFVIIKNNEWTKKLIDFSFAHVREKGYQAWQVDATNSNISSIMEKYGAKPKYTRYYKEFD